VDIVAHGLWVGIGLAALRRTREVPRATAAAAVAMAVAPDLVQLLPWAWAAATQPGGLAMLRAYVTALPGWEPAQPRAR
jgi:hypothetical protein